MSQTYKTQAASDLLRQHHTLSIPAIAESKSLDQNIKKILTRWPDIVTTISEKNRQILLEGLMQRVLSWNWQNIKMRTICSGARYVFDTPFLKDKYFQKLRDFYLKEAALNPSETFLKSVFKAYLESYQPKAPHTISLAESLWKRSKNLPHTDQKLLENLPEVGDPISGVQKIAKKISTKKQPYLYLVNLGLSSTRASGIMTHIHHAYMETIAPKLSRRPAIEAVFNWLKPEGQERVNSHAETALDALLKPWRTTQPETDLKDYLQTTLLELYGDPRTHNGDVWGRVKEENKNVLLRWLTKDDIIFFMDVVSEAEDSHMWDSRRKFWLDLYEKNLITAAWVAFSREAFSVAEHIKARNPVMKGRQFAAQHDRKNTSLLIMQIGKLIVVEGSHSYRVHFFNRDLDKDTPKLFQLHYYCDQIRLQSRHMITHNSGWEKNVLAYLSEHSGNFS